MLCLLRTSDAELQPCSCQLPCDEHIYDIAVSTSGPWPQKAYQHPFYDQFVKDRRYADRLERFAEEKV